MKSAALLIRREDVTDLPDRAGGKEPLWTPKLVKAALVEAYEVYRYSMGRVGHKASKAAWPSYYREWGDWIEQAETSGSDAVRRRRRPSGIDIQRADTVLLGWTDHAGVQHPAWLNGDVTEYERARKSLVAWVMAKHHGVPEVALCQRCNWPLATFKRHKDFAAGRIATTLNQAGLAVW
ncbi:hypothetical protein JP75_07725 [Devosia riboflavina]|uniref:Uncharacterized protein n=1 Tax=Devosia riboflavina TaxID=46914 RepID=A0A087M3I3_9HYPH|nr:hypothetical protein [Devosia riboflavina]KFL31436.1 hypothetical protein JP75_07725 [Devosia riboflavina]